MSSRGQLRLRLLLRPLRRREQEARQAFLRMRQEEQALEAGVRCCRVALALQDDWARSALRAGRVANLSAYRQCVADLNGEMDRKRSALAAVEDKLQEQRLELEHCMKQRKAYEQVVRRQEAAAAAEAARKDTRELDHVHAAQSAWRAEDEQGWQTQT
jgi:flagellar biosynthesis chaperone FliJ